MPIQWAELEPGSKAPSVHAGVLMGTENSSDDLLSCERSVSLSLCSEQLEAECTKITHCVGLTAPSLLLCLPLQLSQWPSISCKGLLKDLEEQIELWVSLGGPSKQLTWSCKENLSWWSSWMALRDAVHRIPQLLSERSAPLIPSSLLSDSHGLLGSKLDRCLGVVIMNLSLQISGQQSREGREISSASAHLYPSLHQISIMAKGNHGLPWLPVWEQNWPVASCTHFSNFWLAACVCRHSV